MNSIYQENIFLMGHNQKKIPFNSQNFHLWNIPLLLTHWPTHHHISWRKKSPSYIFVVCTIIVVSRGFLFKILSLIFKLCSFLRYYIWLFNYGTRNISFSECGLYNFDGWLVHCYILHELMVKYLNMEGKCKHLEIYQGEDVN